MTVTPKLGSTAILARPHVLCPHCKESNTDDKGRVWWVHDERGLHFDCANCSHVWKNEYEGLNRWYPPREGS